MSTCTEVHFRPFLAREGWRLVWRRDEFAPGPETGEFWIGVTTTPGHGALDPHAWTVVSASQLVLTLERPLKRSDIFSWRRLAQVVFSPWFSAPLGGLSGWYFETWGSVLALALMALFALQWIVMWRRDWRPL